MAVLNIPAGTRLKINGQKVEVEEESPIIGNYLPDEEKKQKTYSLKCICPICKRILRLTKKVYDQGPLICGATSHDDRPAIFTLADETLEDGGHATDTNN